MITFISRFRDIFSSLFRKKKVIRLGIYGEPNVGKTSLANRISLDWLGEEVGIVSEIPHETRVIQKKEHVEVKVGSKTLIMNLLDMPGLATKVDFKSFMKFRAADDKPLTKNQMLKKLKVSQLKRVAKETNVNSIGKKTKIVKELDAAITKDELLDVLKKLEIPRPKSSRVKKTKITEKTAKDRAKEATEGIIEAIRWLDDVDTVLVMMDSTKDPRTQVNLMLIGQLEAKSIPLVVVANKIDLTNANTSEIQDTFPQHPVVPISAKRGDNLENLYEAIVEHSR